MTTTTEAPKVVHNLVRVVLEGKIIFGISDGFALEYYAKGAGHMAYGLHPDFPDLEHYTDSKVVTVVEMLKELSVIEYNSEGADSGVK